MRWTLPIAGLLLTGCSHSVPPPPVPTMAVFVWNQPPAVPGIMMGNYILRDVNTGQVVGTPLRGQTTWTLTPLPTPGLRTYSLVITGTNENGNLVTSPPATVTISIP